MKKKLIFVSLPIILIFYTITFSRYITEIDCGELLSVQSTYGIAHPSGYPLFTLLGYLITKLPINVSNIIKLNYLATIYVFLSIFVFIFLLKHRIYIYIYFNTFYQKMLVFFQIYIEIIFLKLSKSTAY